MTELFDKARNLARDNSPAILTGIGVAGAITTAYLAAKASFKAARIIDAEEFKGGTADTAKQRLKERVPLVWKCYIPPAITGVITVGCIIGASNVSARRTVAATSAYTLTERAFSEYRDKVAETYGERKEQRVRDEIAEDKVLSTPPNGVVAIGSGNVLCCELYTGRYFESTMETLRRVQNEINHKLNSNVYVLLSDFYYAIGLADTSNSHGVGWDSAKQLELQFSTVLTPEGIPCLAFEYNYCKPL